MTRASRWAIAVVLSVALPAVGQDVVEVPLTFKPFKDIKEMLSLSAGGSIRFLSAIPPKGYKAPSGTIRPMFFTVSRTLVGMAAQSSPQAPAYDRLWVDWNGDKVFTNDEALTGTVVVMDKEKFTLFGPVKRSWEGQELEGYFVIRHGDPRRLMPDSIHLVPTGYWEGTVSLGNRTVKLGLVDTNLNGSLGDSLGASGRQRADVLLVDFDGNGAFTVTAETWLLGEVFYLTDLVQMPDGAFYHLKGAEGKPAVLLERDNSPVRKVKVAFNQFLVVGVGPGGFMLVRGRNGETCLPAGSYQDCTVLVAKRYSNGQMWAVAFQASFRVVEGEDKNIPFGPPFKLALAVERRDSAFEFSLSLKDKEGHEVSGIFTPKDGFYEPDTERPPAPVLVIGDAKGKVVKTEKFHYG